MPRKLYVGRNLPKTTSEKELEEVFAKYGRLTNVWVARNPPGFAYVEYEDERDAEEALKSVQGTIVAGVPLSVEFAQSSGPKPRGSWRPPYDDRRGGGYDDRRGGGYDDRRSGYDDRRRSPPRGDDRGGAGRYDWNPAGGARRSRSRSRGRGDDRVPPPAGRYEDRAPPPRRDDYRDDAPPPARRDSRDFGRDDDRGHRH